MNDDRNPSLDSAESWVIAVFGMVILTLVWGVIFTFTVYADQLREAYGLSAFRTSAVFSITTAAFFVAGGSLGVVIARFPLRPVVVAVGLLFGLGIGALQFVSSYLGVVVAFGLIGTAGGTTFVIVTALVPQWFDAYQGRATGVAMIGNGLGVLVLPYAWLWLFDRTDVRGAFAVVGGATVAVILAASLFYRRPPGVGPAAKSPIDATWLRSQLADRRFRVALAGFALMWSWYFVLSAGLVEILTTSGIARSVAVTAFGTIGGISVLTRVVSGALADRVGLRSTLTGSVGLAAAAVFALILTETVPAMYVTLAVFGFSLGAIATLFPPVILGKFGPENAVAIVGLFTIAESTTAFLAPVGVDGLVVLTGGHAIPLALLGVVTLVGVGMFHWGTRPATDRA